MNSVRKSPHRFFVLAILWMALSMVFTACTASPATQAPKPAVTQPAIEASAIRNFEDLKAIFREIRGAAPERAQAQADKIWQGLLDSGRVPLVLGTQVVFLYKGEADQVSWSGVFNGWSTPGLAGTRVGDTDLWIAYLEVPEASRIEYKIILNGEDWIVDPANPNTTFSGLTGANNVVALEGFSVTDESKERSDVTPGTLSEALSIDSQALGYTVDYWVYTPAGYEGLRDLPVIYVLDGNDFVDDRMGALPNVLDNMISDGRIRPVLAVFINEREPGNPQRNRREDEFLVHPIEHATFVADELVPVIDQTYRTDPRPEARLITGVSYGGLSAYYMAASRSDTFHNLAAFSPSMWVLGNPQYLSNPEQAEGSQKMLPALSEEAAGCGGDTGFECPRFPVKIFLSTGWPDWDVGDLRYLAADLEAQKYPVEFHQVREGHSWDNWRGLSDEMLTYFFSPD